jgi:hypothetical protein
MTTIISILLVVLCLSHLLATIITYGFMSKDNEQFLITYLKENQLRLNMYDKTILSNPGWEKFMYISVPPIPIIFSYQVENMGLVLRGSELHYLIKQQFKQAK